MTLPVGDPWHLAREHIEALRQLAPVLVEDLNNFEFQRRAWRVRLLADIDQLDRDVDALGDEVAERRAR